jgi:signal transduction histidine kinase
MPVVLNSAYEVVRRAGGQNDPAEALRSLLDDCVTATAADCGVLYLLDLTKGAYIQFAVSPGTPTDEVVDIRPRDAFVGDPILVKAVSSLEPIRLQQYPSGQSIGGARLVVPISRDRACLGLIDLSSKRPGLFTDEHRTLVQTASVVAVLICEKEDVVTLLGQLHTPVDYHQGFDEFLDTLMLLVASASQMPLIALRELREDDLHCLREYGFAAHTEEDLHLSPMSASPLFQRAVSTRSIVATDKTDADVVAFLTRFENEHIRSFIIVPVLVGTGVFGTLSFAVRCEHEYTALERQGLSVIANAVGVAISNYRNFQAAEERLFEQAKIGAAITTVDVAQSARHEARNHLAEAQEALGVLAAKLDALPARLREEIRESVDQVSNQLLDAGTAMQKIKTITKPAEREKTPQRIDDLWREAFVLVLGRLEQLQIRWNVRGTAHSRVAVDYIRTAFLNLILNSIDAFRAAKKKGRIIEVTIEASDRAKDVVIRYMDNASGIDPSKLGPAGDGSTRSVTDIFEPGVTSKPEGSGYGMYLVRKIMTEHRGSIDLLDHRNGVVFQLKLPQYSLKASESKNEQK